MHNIVADIISQTFSKEPGKHQAKSEKPQAFVVSFSTRLDYNKEEGYRYLDLVLYAPHNYVQVWVRSSWNVIALEDLNDDGEGLKPGKDYTEGESQWECIGDHDSGWRESVREFLYKNRAEILGFSSAAVFGEWYKVVDFSTLNIPNAR
jgi:hypothetical protein